ncbi:hypothetical protein RF11_09293 [Thelohanellus kitauei]|uniref:Uncharacterized protein n=1 Tax=Thelohanellus kitauei TaxID=669202 RepID=A0A0C2J6U0_THEKT|nr:hypothetical protein RF11_09293 [Thelohanellus kitauei]
MHFLGSDQRDCIRFKFENETIVKLWSHFKNVESLSILHQAMTSKKYLANLSLLSFLLLGAVCQAPVDPNYKPFSYNLNIKVIAETLKEASFLNDSTYGKSFL